MNKSCFSDPIQNWNILTSNIIDAQYNNDFSQSRLIKTICLSRKLNKQNLAEN